MNTQIIHVVTDFDGELIGFYSDIDDANKAYKELKKCDCEGICLCPNPMIKSGVLDKEVSK